MNEKKSLVIDRLTLETTKLTQSYEHVSGLLANRMALISQLSEPLTLLYSDTMALKESEWKAAKEQHDAFMEHAVELNEKLKVLPELHAAVKALRASVDHCANQIK
mmetsp:Transcript_3425/g.5047  ORF Transcript_3425/g.5047 Transcript_3425/m.5047 type:complete len:106 (+) Transcript_3425:39-356(+)